MFTDRATTSKLQETTQFRRAFTGFVISGFVVTNLACQLLARLTGSVPIDVAMPAGAVDAVRTVTATVSPAAISTHTATPWMPDIDGIPAAFPTPTATPSFFPTETVSLPVFPGTAIVEGIEAIHSQNARDAGEGARWGVPSAMSVHVSDDGAWVLVGTAFGLYVIDTAAREEVLCIETDLVQQLVIAPAAGFIAGAGHGEVAIWEFPSGDVLLAPVSSHGHVSRLEFVNSRPDLAILTTTGDLIVMDGHSGRVEALSSAGDITTLASDPERGVLAYVNVSGDIYLRDVHQHLNLAELPGSSGEVNDLAFSPDGAILVSAGSDGRLFFWDVSSAKRVRIIPAHRNGVWGLQFSADGKWLSSIGADGLARVWHVREGWQHVSFMHQAGCSGVYALACAAFSPDGVQMVTGGAGGTIQVWTTYAGMREHILHAGYPLASVSFSADGRSIIAYTRQRELQFWDIPSGERIEPVLDLGLPVNHVLVPAGDEALLVSFQGGGSSWISRVNGEELIIPLAQALQWATHVTLSPDGMRVAARRGSTVLVWQVDSPQRVRTFTGHAGSITDIAFSADGQQVAASAADNSIRIWNSYNAELQRVILPGGDDVQAIAYAHSVELPLLAVAAAADRVEIWNVQRRELFQCIEVQGQIWDVVFSADDHMLAMAMSDGRILIWDVNQGTERFLLKEDNQDMTHLAVSLQSGLLAAGSRTGVITLWDIERGQRLTALTGHVGGITDLSFDSSGRQLISTSLDGTLRVWQVPAR